MFPPAVLLFLIDVPPTTKLDQTKSPSRKMDFQVFVQDRACRGARCQVTQISLGEPSDRSLDLHAQSQGQVAKQPRQKGGRLIVAPREGGVLLVLQSHQFCRASSKPCPPVLHTYRRAACFGVSAVLTFCKSSLSGDLNVVSARLRSCFESGFL